VHPLAIIRMHTLDPPVRADRALDDLGPSKDGRSGLVPTLGVLGDIPVPDDIVGRLVGQAIALGQFEKLLLRRLAHADVGKRHPHRRTASARLLQRVFKLRLESGTIAALQGQFHAQGCCVLPQAQKLAQPGIPVRRRHVGHETMLQQGLAFPAQQLDAGEVDLLDDAFGRKRQVAEWGKFVEIEVAVAGFLQGMLRLAQGLVLHFQFDLVHLQFVQQFGLGPLGRGLRRSGELRLGGRAQGRGLVGGGHGVTSSEVPTRCVMRPLASAIGRARARISRCVPSWRWMR
jgi:hypothetical protein